jgi:biotin carboxyl carrier protein
MSGLQGKVGNQTLKWKKIPSGPTGEGEVEVDGKSFTVQWKKDAEGLWLEFSHGVFGFDIHGDVNEETGSGLLYRVRERESDRLYMGLKYQGMAEALAEGQNAGKKKSARVRAQMPGKIVKIHVKVGDAVTKGQSLIVMEAMKMENEIKATQTGMVEKIHVSEGQAVESGADLLVIT